MSTSIDSAFKRIDTQYRGGGRGGVLQSPQAPGATFRASRAYDKLIALTTIVLVSGIVGALFVPVGLAFACIFIAFGLVLVSWFRMRWAKVLAPAYAVTEGIALGAISSAYNTIGHGIVPTAIVFTGVVFITCLGLYRTGLVRVTPRLVNLAIMGAMGILVVSLLSLVLSLFDLPNASGLGPIGLIIGVVFLGVAILNLFTDFNFATRSEQMGVSADAEWSAAFAMLTALVLVYLSILRILAVIYGGGGGRRR
jgi:uncharacterized YccA/Bax inhibitor family protein